jgi:diguanylate cyclase (GGDEF)-like protein/PAS domain S-box-containing protein
MGGPTPRRGALDEILADPTEQYRLLIEESSDVLAIHDPDGRLRWLSPSIERMVGWTAEERMSATTSLVHPDDQSAIDDVHRRLRAGEDSGSARVRLLHKDGRHVWVTSSARAWRDDAGAIVALVVVTHDIDEVVRADQERRETETLYRLIAENANDVVLETVDGVIRWVSPSVLPVLGWKPEQLLGRPAWDYLHPDDVRTVQADSERVHAGTSVAGRARGLAADGSYRWFARTHRPLRGLDGTVVSHVTGLRDVHEQVLAELALRESEEHYRRLAEHDRLTGVLQRGPLLADLEVRLSHPGRGSRPPAVLYIDVDGLREVNNTFGHGAGDELLRTVADRLRETLRADDLLARVGGDEFVAVLPGAGTTDDAAFVAEKLHTAVHRPVTIARTTLTPTISIGIAHGSEGQSAADVVEEADQQLLVAKRGGKHATAAGGQVLRARGR